MALNIFRKKIAAENAPATSAPVQDISRTTGTVSVPVSWRGQNVLKHFYVSEKSTRLAGLNQYVFRVHSGATKREIAKAVNDRFGVTVTAVNVITVPRKSRTVGRRSGFRSGFKKAIVALRAGDTIAQAQP